jgi:hypothetical protein
LTISSVIEVLYAVIASAAKQSIEQRRKYGLLRRCAPLRKRFAFVAGNDGIIADCFLRAARPK